MMIMTMTQDPMRSEDQNHRCHEVEVEGMVSIGPGGEKADLMKGKNSGRAC